MNRFVSSFLENYNQVFCVFDVQPLTTLFGEEVSLPQVLILLWKHHNDIINREYGMIYSEGLNMLVDFGTITSTFALEDPSHPSVFAANYLLHLLWNKSGVSFLIPKGTYGITNLIIDFNSIYSEHVSSWLDLSFSTISKQGPSQLPNILVCSTTVPQTFSTFPDPIQFTPHHIGWYFPEILEYYDWIFFQPSSEVLASVQISHPLFELLPEQAVAVANTKMIAHQAGVEWTPDMVTAYQAASTYTYTYTIIASILIVTMSVILASNDPSPMIEVIIT